MKDQSQNSVKNPDVSNSDNPLSPFLNKTVLLVEDTQSILLTEQKMLDYIGFKNVVIANDGQEAIEKVSKYDIDLIISDWNMPNLSGFEFLQWVKQDVRFKDIPFIMATSQAEKEQANRAIDAGVAYYLIKPFGPLELSYAIQTIFDPKGAEKIQKTQNRMTESGKVRISIAHIPITDHVVLGVLQHLITTKQLIPKNFELDIQSKLLWNPVQTALDDGDVDAALILAPIVMDLFNHGTPVKIVLLAHKNGSICVRNKAFGSVDLDKASLKNFFKSKVFYLPHTLSVHRILADIYLRDLGLNPGYVGQDDVDVRFEVIPPIMMPDFQSQDVNAGGFMVAEPIGAKAIDLNVGEELVLSGKLWSDHPCCVVAMREEFIDSHPEATQEFVNMFIQAGQFVEANKKEAARIAVPFLDADNNLGYSDKILEKVFMDENGIKTVNLKPDINDFDRIQKFMFDHHHMGTCIDLEKLIDTQFID